MDRSAPPVVLTIAGSDSFGGAGIQADLKTFMVLGVHGATAITALTAQNSMGVSGVHAAPPAFVKEQIAQVFADAPVSAVKTGMLWSAGIIEAVADSLTSTGMDRVVVDPVLVSASKAALVEDDALQSLAERLLPLALIVTPNLEEASALSGREVVSLAGMKDAAKRIGDLGPAWVLIKGGHLDGDPVDLLFDGETLTEIPGPRIPGRNTHGSGCTLAAAIAARLALGDGVEAAAQFAKRFVTRSIQYGLAVGAGPGPVNQGWALSDPEVRKI